MSRGRAKVGDVIQIDLPDGRYAYGRVLRDASVAFYRQVTAEPTHPQIGSRDYQFVIGVHDGVFRRREVSVVGFDPSMHEADDWPPPSRVNDPISGTQQVYERGVVRSATAEECAGLEPAAVWELHHLIDRLVGA